MALSPSLKYFHTGTVELSQDQAANSSGFGPCDIDCLDCEGLSVLSTSSASFDPISLILSTNVLIFWPNLINGLGVDSSKDRKPKPNTKLSNGMEKTMASLDAVDSS
ncbi:hypothetical protein Tco_0418449 [Tanacetum coccineum]